MEQLEKIYAKLNLGDFETVRKSLQDYLESHKSYQTNKYKPLGQNLEADITRRWGAIIRKQGYPIRESHSPLPESH